jgi:transposase
MSRKPAPLQPVPEETARVARAIFLKGNPSLTLRDQLGVIFQDDDCVDLSPNDGHPGLSPWRFALITIIQFHENLANRHAAEAVWACIDWTSLLGLALTDAGGDFSVLRAFRDRLLAGSTEERL